MPMTKRKPATVGEILVEEFMQPMGLTQAALAEAMGVQRKHVNELCNGRRNVTAATALPSTLEQVAAELRGGGTVAGAVERLAHGDGPVAQDLRRVHVRTRLGLGLEDALGGWPAEHRSSGSAPRSFSRIARGGHVPGRESAISVFGTACTSPVISDRARWGSSPCRDTP